MFIISFSFLWLIKFLWEILFKDKFVVFKVVFKVIEVEEVDEEKVCVFDFSNVDIRF